MNALEKSEKALALLKEAILETIAEHQSGIGNNAIARALNLESDFAGNQKNYLSWSVIGLLVNEGKIKYEKKGTRKLYYLNQSAAYTK